MKISGKFNEAVVKIDKELNSETTAKIIDILNTRMVDKEIIRILPNIEITSNNFINGYSQTFSGKLLDPDIFANPYDGILAAKFKESTINIESVKNFITNSSSIHHENFNKKLFFKYLKKQLEKARSNWPEKLNYKNLGEIDKIIHDLLKKLNIDETLFWKSFGYINKTSSINIGKDFNNPEYLWIFIKTNSGLVGYKFWKYWKKLIYKNREIKIQLKNKEKEIKFLFKGNRELIKSKLNKLHESSEYYNSPSRFIKNEDLCNYLQELYFIKSYVEFNRFFILDKFKNNLNLENELDLIESSFNSLDLNDRIIRHGAIKSNEGKKLIITTVDNSNFLICKGLNNTDWNYSVPSNIKSINDLDNIKDIVEINEIVKILI